MRYCLILVVILVSPILFSMDYYLGYTPDKVIEIFGAPHHLEVERGGNPAEDDVIFFYNSRLYLYFNQNRVWQVRMDRFFDMDVDGLRIGDTQERVLELFGNPDKTESDSLLYHREDMGFPVFLKVYLLDEKVDDIYLFRGDY